MSAARKPPPPKRYLCPTWRGDAFVAGKVKPQSTRCCVRCRGKKPVHPFRDR